MSFQLSQAGAISSDLARKVNQWWWEAATKANVNLADFDPDAPLGERIARALQVGLLIATIYARYSSKKQHSIEDQLRECVVWAAGNGMYVPPDLICVDEAVSGKRIRRDGLQRMKQILQDRHASVLLLYKVSRLFRQAYLGFQLIQEEVVEEGLRAVSVSQGIDTDDKTGWKLKLQTHGLMDDLLLETIADHVRASQRGLILSGWTTGAVGVGYHAVEVPGAPLTNRGLPRTMPQVFPEAAELIKKHAQLHLDGMSLRAGWRRWLAKGGPCDPRSTTGRMSYGAYRRLWSNIRLTGRWEFGRNRNQYSTKRDYVRQIEQPESEITIFQCEELRILDDETYLALQAWLAGFKSGPRGPRKQKQVQLWDLVTEMIFCAHCSTPEMLVRFYQTGAQGLGMQCKNGVMCPCASAVNREKSVRAICDKLTELLARDAALIEAVICRSREVDARGDDHLRKRIQSLEAKVRSRTSQLDDLYELSGQGSPEDRKEVMARIRSVQAARAEEQLEFTRLQKQLAGSTATLSADDVRKSLADVTKLLSDAAEGGVEDDALYRALAVFRRMTGGRIMVHVEKRPARKQTNVRGVFRPQLLHAVSETVGREELDTASLDEEVSVWLREPPRCDRLALRVHELIDCEDHSFRSAAKILQAERHHVNSGVVWQIYERYYEMIGQPKPKRPYNNGRRRQSE